VLSAAELAGFIGAGLAGAAYVPQIWHLISAHCSAGISRLAFAVWLAASLLVTTHAVAIRATVFITLGAIQLAATALILVYATKYESSYCAIHLPRSPEPAPEAALPRFPQPPGGGPAAQPHPPQTCRRANRRTNP
jgi:hypothetical protein